MTRTMWGIGSVLFGLVIFAMANVLTVNAYDPVSEPLVTVDSNQTVGTFTAVQTSSTSYEISISIDEPWCAIMANVTINIPLTPSTEAEVLTSQPCERLYRYTGLQLNVGDSISASVTVYDESVNDNTVDVEIGGSATLTNPRTGTDSYWDLDVNGAGLSGTYDGWCLNFNHLLIDPDNTYTVDIEEYDGTTGSSLINPADFDIMWWIINESGETDPFVVQYALWILNGTASPADIRDRYLLNPPYYVAPRPDVDQDLADAQDLLQLALIAGEGYDPGCGDGTMSGVALVPRGTDPVNGLPNQELLIVIPLPCDTIDTEEARATIQLPPPLPEDDQACLKFDPAEQSLYYQETPTFHLEVRNCDTGQETHGPFQVDRMVCDLPAGVQVLSSPAVNGGFFQNHSLDPVTNVLTFTDLQVPNFPPGLLPEGQNFDVYFTASISEAPARSQLACLLFVDGEPDARAEFDLTVRGLDGADPEVDPPEKAFPGVPQIVSTPQPPPADGSTTPPNANPQGEEGMPTVPGF